VRSGRPVRLRAVPSFPQVAQAIQSVNSNDIQPYIDAIRRNVCSVCQEQEQDGPANLDARSNVPSTHIFAGGGRHRRSHRQRPSTKLAFPFSRWPGRWPGSANSPVTRELEVSYEFRFPSIFRSLGHARLRRAGSIHLEESPLPAMRTTPCTSSTVHWRRRRRCPKAGCHR
jgi:hypothetical protein